jgi:hypothetical protein
MKSSTKKQSGDKPRPDPEVDALVARLERAAERLNEAAQRGTRRIEALEERLGAIEAGIESWGPTLLSEPTTFHGENGVTPEAALREVTLGYAKVKKDKWGIAVRDVVKASSGRLLSENVSLLLRAERNLRLLALPHLTSLTRQLVEAVEAQAAGLEDAGETRDEEAAEEEGELAAHAAN